MQFLYPSFLVALGFMAIPIIVHLFNFVKYKKIYFSNVHFLKEVKEETQSRSRLKHLLILISRLMAILFLVFSFAQPFIPAKNAIVKEGAKAVSIYIDNSFSMAAIGKNGTLLDEAKKDASDIIKAFGPTDQFQLLTNDFLGKHQHWVNKKVFTEMLEEVSISPAVKKIDEIVSRQHDMLANTNNQVKLSYIISDFQKPTFNLNKLKNDSTITHQLIPLVGNITPNVYIDSCWFVNPARQFNQPEVLHVKILNTGSNDVENVPVKLMINGQQRAIASANIKAESSVEIELAYTNKESGIINGQIIINDYPLTYDNDYFFSYHVNKKINLLFVNQKDENTYLNKLFVNDPLFEVVQNSPKNIDYGSLGNYNLLVLSNLDEISSGLINEIKLKIEKGLNVLVFPGTKAKLDDYNNLLSNFSSALLPIDTVTVKVEKINFKHPIYSGVFEEAKMKKENVNFPLVSKHYPIKTNNKGNQESLIYLMNGEPFLLQFSLGLGKLYFCSSSLDEKFSSFPRHAIFVPTLYKIAITSSFTEPLFYTIGNNQNIELKKTNTQNDPVYHIHSADGKTDFIAQTKSNGFSTRIDAEKQIKNAGNYWLKTSTKDTLKGLSFNYNRLESNTNYYSLDELEKDILSYKLNNYKIIEKRAKNMAATMLNMSKGTQLWKWCVIFALLCLGIEIALIRWMKG
ncbi:MAG TPA: BatA domain-containing protein [Bacteroidia bacterium]|nr:BatA domain-containing protein [Bacteroidia bacterium]